MKSLKRAPASTLRWWGLQSADAFDCVTHFLIGEGFAGPRTWAEGALVPFDKTLTPDIKATASLSVFSADNGYAAFDCRVILSSTTLGELKRQAGWETRSDGKDAAYAPCLTISLAHLKWCQNPGSENPSWAMTLESDTTRPGVQTFIADFAHLMRPILDSLTTDDALEALMTTYLSRAKPGWVLSSAPWFARLPELVGLMRGRARHMS